MIKLMFPGNEISSSDGRPIPRLLQRSQLLLINLVIGNDAAHESGIILQIIGGYESRKIMLIPCRRSSRRRRPAAVDTFDQGFRDTITVVPHVILNAGAIFANMVSPDNPAILQVDDFCPRIA